MNIMKRLSCLLSILILLVSFIPAPAAASDDQKADRVYVNGNIYTVDEEFSTASAIAVKNGQFIYVGDDAGAEAYVDPLTFVFDLKGKTVIPGLHDAHVHIRYGERELYPRTPDIRAKIGEWASVKRMQEVIKRCLAMGEGMRPGPEPRWLVLSGWMSDVWDPPVFHKELIDAVAPDNPVFISRYTHGSGANSKALELAGITRDTPDPPGGWIPEQAMTREEALRAATMGSAYVMHAEDILGSIEVGKLADFVVIPVDYMTIPAEDIWKIEPEMTVIGGEIVYTRPVQAQK